MTEMQEDPDATETVTASQVEIVDNGQVVANANISAPTQPHGTATVSFHAQHGQLPANTRRNLVDAVMDQPEVSVSDHLHAAVPIGDSESITQLRSHTTNLRARPAGSSSMIEADVSSDEDEL